MQIKGDATHAKKSYKECSDEAAKLGKDMQQLQSGLSSIGNIPGISNVVAHFNTLQGSLSSIKGLGVAGLLGAGIGAVAGIVGTAVSRMIEFTAATIEQGKAIRLTSAQLGITVEHYQAFAKLATRNNVDPEQWAKGFAKLNTALGELRMGSEDAEKKFAKMGISAEKAAGKSTLEVYNMVADRIKGTQSASERAAIAAEAFGEKAGPKLVNMLAQGSTGLAATMAALKSSGKMLDSDELLNLSNFQKSLTKLKESFGGIWNSILKAVLPIAQAIANVVIEIAGAVEKYIATVKKAWEWLAGKDSHKTYKDKETETLGDMNQDQKLDYYQTRIAELKQKGGQLNRDELNDLMEYQAKAKAISADMQSQFVANKTKQSQSKVDELKKEVNDELDHKTKLQKEADKLKDQIDKGTIDPAKGAAMIAELTALDAKKKHNEEITKELEKQKQHYDQLASKAKSISEQANPALKMREQVKELQEMVMAGLLDPKTMSRELAKTRDSIIKGLMAEAPKTQAGYIEANTTEAARELAAERERAEQMAYAEKQLATMEESVSAQDKTNGLLSDIKDQLGGNETWGRW